MTTGGCKGTNSFTLSVEVGSEIFFSTPLLLVEQVANNTDDSIKTVADIKRIYIFLFGIFPRFTNYNRSMKRFVVGLSVRIVR